MLRLAWLLFYTVWVEFSQPIRIDHFVHNDEDRKTELLNLSLQ